MSFLYSVRLEEAASNDVLVDLVIYLYRTFTATKYKSDIGSNQVVEE